MNKNIICTACENDRDLCSCFESKKNNGWIKFTDKMPDDDTDLYLIASKKSNNKFTYQVAKWDKYIQLFYVEIRVYNEELGTNISEDMYVTPGRYKVITPPEDL
jgi:hypothetical protein